MTPINSRASTTALLSAMSCALLIIATAGCASASVARSFSFKNSLNYMDADQAMTAAKAFIVTQLPAGLSQAKAVARLSRADMHCERPTASNTLNCSYWSSIDDKWTVRVKLDDRGTVRAARVDHEHIGVDPN